MDTSLNAKHHKNNDLSDLWKVEVKRYQSEMKQNNFISMSLWFQFDFTSISLRIHFDLTLISLRIHFDFPSISLRFHMGKRENAMPHKGKGKTRRDSRRDKREKGKAPPGIWTRIPPGNQTARTHERNETISTSESPPNLRFSQVHVFYVNTSMSFE